MRLLAPSRGTHTYWEDKDPVIFEGVIGLTKDRLFPGSLEYFIGDGTHKYSELPKYGGAEASILSKAYTLVLRDANGLIDSASIPASTITKPNNVVKADGNGSLSGWKDAIINAIIANDGSGGLSTDENGNMMVDFDQMPTDKFEALLKSLKMQIPLSANLNLYVDKNHVNASDNTTEIVVGDTTHKRGEQNYPFKTIQACVNYATTTYAVGSKRITIYVVQADYDESVILPDFTRTTGEIHLRAVDYALPPRITKLSVQGGTWEVYRVNIVDTVSDPNNGVSNYHYVVNVSRAGTTLSLYGCSITTEYEGAASATRYVLVPVHVTDGATLTFGILKDYQNSLHCVKGNASSAYMIQTELGGRINIPRSNTEYDSTTFSILCSGSVSFFATASGNSTITTTGAALNGQVFTGTVTGTKYRCVDLSIIAAPFGGFPGDVDGTADSTTFSIYSESNS